MRTPLYRAAGSLVAGAAALQYVPSVVALGQWAQLRVLPMDLCRWQGRPDLDRVALTFDDGPDPRGTPAVLDRLDELGLEATFFPLGSAATRHGDLLTEVVRRGHGVGTHGYAHGHHLARGPGWVRRDLRAASAAMDRAGVPIRWFRPPYGQVTAATLISATKLGWKTVLWSAWGREWTTGDPRAVAARIRCRLRPGAIVLLHDSDGFGPPGMWRTVCDALGPIAEDLDRRGLRAVSLDALVA